jgi:transcriptional regulator with XRE-family HTH domain
MQDCTIAFGIARRIYFTCLERLTACPAPREVSALAERRSPSVRARQLASELRRLREEATLTGEEAAGRLGWSASKVSRIETGRTAITAGDLRRMLDLYQVSGVRRDRLAELGRTARQRGWWDAYADTITSGYSTLIALEADAEFERDWSPIIISGLLQTESYAQAITRATTLITPPGELSRIVTARTTRQGVLTREDPLELATVLDEATLRRPVGGSEVMREQLLHLLDITRRPNVTLQVLPFASGPHLAVDGAFTLLQFPEAAAAGVVFIQNMTSDLFIEREDEVYRYGLAFDRLRELALMPEDSVSFITNLANEYQ